MYSLKDGAARKLNFFSSVSQKEISSRQSQSEKNKISGEELFWIYHKWIIEDMQLPADKSWDEIWKKLTKEQKIVYTLGIFISESNNGGVWQFLFNRPDLAAAAGQSLETVKPYMIWVHYARVFKEFVKILENEEFLKMKNIFNDESIPFEKRWETFKNGADYVPSSKEIEEYLYKDDYKKKFYDKINSFIKMNLGKMIHVESEQPSKVIQKKDAIAHFTAYLKEFYGNEPTSADLYYTGRVTIDNQPGQLFLISFTMPDGFESIGITGYFTHHFSDISREEIKKMHQKFHKQELVNIYYGWYLVHRQLEQNPEANKVEQKKWQKLLSELQDSEKTQVPVNVELLDYIKMTDEEWFIFTGDLLYNDKKDNFPKDLSSVDLSQASGKEQKEYSGETDLIFHNNGVSRKGFGRRSRNRAVSGKYPLYATVGNQHKLLKDNPWGF